MNDGEGNRPQKIIVIGASAGGVETLMKLSGSLPARLPAAVFIVLHTPPTGNSLLPQILSRQSQLPTQHARHEQEIETGIIYIAPPNHHMLVSNNHIYLSLGPPENSHRSPPPPKTLPVLNSPLSSIDTFLRSQLDDITLP